MYRIISCASSFAFILAAVAACVLIPAMEHADLPPAQERLVNLSDSRAELAERLDSLASFTLAEETVAGFSVAVLHGSDTLLMRGYGLADVGLQVPATAETKYRLVGPSATMQAALLMQLVEQNRITLDQDITPLLPGFPWQGKRVSLRELMNATSGLPDYHYLGDPYQAQIAVPKSYDDVTALFAGRPFTHEPGERFQWTISGFHLAGVLLEQLTGRRFSDLLVEEISHPLELKHTAYCGNREVVSALATGYVTVGDSLLRAGPISPSINPFGVTVCASAGDVGKFYRALREGRLIRAESYADMTMLSAAAEEAFQREGEGPGVGIFITELGGHRMTSMYGSLQIGAASAAIDFPTHDLTVVVLRNSPAGRSNYQLALNLSRVVLGLPLPESEARDVLPPLRDLPISAVEMDRYVGTYRTRRVNPPLTHHAYERTYRVYNESGRLMIQPVGSHPELLLKQGEHTFAPRSVPRDRFVFTVEDGHASEIVLHRNDRMFEQGARVDKPEAMPRQESR
jgi:D-alanyl-D-alanine carboxypeptidase